MAATRRTHCIPEFEPENWAQLMSAFGPYDEDDWSSDPDAPEVSKVVPPTSERRLSLRGGAAPISAANSHPPTVKPVKGEFKIKPVHDHFHGDKNKGFKPPYSQRLMALLPAGYLRWALKRWGANLQPEWKVYWKKYKNYYPSTCRRARKRPLKIPEKISEADETVDPHTDPEVDRLVAMLERWTIKDWDPDPNGAEST